MEKERAVVSAEQTKLKELLLNVFPKSIAEQLLIKGEGSYQPQLIAEEYKEATLLFADIVGFTTMCSDLEPGALLLILDGIFTQWDALVEKYKLQKIKTIGDCFMAAGGVPDRTVDHVERVIDFAMDMTAALHRYNETCQILKSRSLSLNIRIGINTGPVVAGIIGRSRMCFDLWGDAVNVASRMESTSLVGRIQVSQATFNRVKNNYQFEERGSIDVKGKGAMLTYLLVAPRFYRTESGKVIDNRFAQHMYSTPSGKSNANTNSSSTAASEYSPLTMSPVTILTNTTNTYTSPNSGNTTPTINLTASSSSNAMAELSRGSRRGSLGVTPSLTAFSAYHPNNNNTNTSSFNMNNRRGSAVNTTTRPVHETENQRREDNNSNNGNNN
jgi:class 3 adenylate cyclase